MVPIKAKCSPKLVLVGRCEADTPSEVYGSSVRRKIWSDHPGCMKDGELLYAIQRTPLMVTAQSVPSGDEQAQSYVDDTSFDKVYHLVGRENTQSLKQGSLQLEASNVGGVGPVLPDRECSSSRSRF